MENCNQTFTMQLHCSCQEKQRNQQSQQVNEHFDLAPLYQKFAKALQIQLKKQSEAYISQIDRMSSQIFNLKNTVQRLQIRNKKDNQSQKQLRAQYNTLLAKLKEKNQSNRLNQQVKIIERIKEVKVEVIDHDLPIQLARFKKRNQEINQVLTKIKIEKELLQSEYDHLREQLLNAQKIIERLKAQIQEMKKRQILQNQKNQRLQDQISYLKSNKEVIVQTKHFFPNFKQVQKIHQQPQIQTVYVEKPVQKLVFVEVQRKIKEFVQPQRPIVNRIISCEPKQRCQCKQIQTYQPRRSLQLQHLTDVVQKLEGNIKQYKNQRQNLVTIIQNKNRELNSLETQFRLLGNRNQAYRGPSSVNVTVTKLKQQDKPISQKISREAEYSRSTQIKRK